MAKYKSIVITNAGLELVAAMHSGGTIEFTCIKTGSGTYDGSEVLANMADLKNIQQTFGISSLAAADEVVKVRSVLSNSDLTTGYYIKEIGLYAKDPNSNSEIMYAIVVAESGMEDYLPAYSSSPQSITLDMCIAVTGSDNLRFTASIIPGTYVTVEDFNDFSTNMNNQISTISTKLNKASEDLANHVGNKNNPHSVTKSQIGLGNVNNTSDANKPISNATQAALDTKAKSTDLTSHTGNKSNPHSVTKAQVGLGNVPNVATNDQTPTYTDTTTLTTLSSGEKISTAFSKIKLAITNIINHLSNKSNPHSVTKAQVGLGNVDNTSDANKPISTATQEVLDDLTQAIVDVDAVNENTGSPILLTDTADGVATDFKAYGRSVQKQYSGKNLLNCRGLSARTSEGVTFTPVYDDNGNLLYVNANGTAKETALFYIPVNLENGQYIINGCSNGSSNTYCLAVQVRVNSTTNTWYTSYVGDTQFETTDTKVCTYCFVQVNKGATVNNVKFYPMIRKAEVTDGTYEPYVGGTASPSPNPNYPQTIKSVADGGYFDGELLSGYYNASGVFVAGANTTNVGSKKPIPCKGGDVIKIIYEESISAITVALYDENMMFIDRPYKLNTNEFVITAPSNAKYMNFHLSAEYIITPTNAKPITVTINGKYALIVKSKGCLYEGELAQGQYATDGTVTSFASRVSAKNLISCVEGDNINLTYVETVNRLVIAFFKDNVWLSQVIADNVTELSGTVPSGANSFGITILNDNLTPQTAKQIFISINGEGETVTYIPLNEPLRSSLDGSVTDVASLTEVNRKFTEDIFDGSSDEKITLSGVANGYGKFILTLSASQIIDNSLEMLSSHFVVKPLLSTEWANPTENCILKGLSATTKSVIGVIIQGITTVEAFKTWLQANPITVQYELAEPITETIEPVDIITYDNVTYITNPDNADMWVEYYSNSSVGQRLAKTNEEMRAEHRQLQEQITEHTVREDNPHKVTKEQVGLENVPNVATNDQTPTYSIASANANLTSGEKISVAFGKIAKAISSLISHLANKNNPHGVTKAQVGLGNCDNTSDANKPISEATQTALNNITNSLKPTTTGTDAIFCKSGNVVVLHLNGVSTKIDNKSRCLLDISTDVFAQFPPVYVSATKPTQYLVIFRDSETNAVSSANAKIIQDNGKYYVQILPIMNGTLADNADGTVNGTIMYLIN